MAATRVTRWPGGTEKKLGESGEGFVHGRRAVLAARNCLLRELAAISGRADFDRESIGFGEESGRDLGLLEWIEPGRTTKGRERFYYRLFSPSFLQIGRAHV